EPKGEPKRNAIRAFNQKLNELSEQLSPLTPLSPAQHILGAEVSRGLGWSDITILRLMSASGDLLGLLCLGDRANSGELADDHLLHAVAGQSAMALDNCRLFTRIAQANQHWLEIFDAMDDLIVVHDESNRVLRVNRTFAESIGARPAELIGISMRALVNFASARTGQACPFCRGAGEAAGDYIHPVLERTYLVSTSRIQGVLDEGLQTIHVLKDISERREVERRYRELFDNIQEGLFFSTPEGRFVEVNDALVRMLGYDSREELLQAEIGTQIYFSPAQRQRWMAALEQEGVIRNFEESLRRKDGTLIYTLQNTFAVRDAAGKTVQYRGLILDITEQKKFQSQLQRERDFSSKVLNNTQSLILVADTAGLVSFANRRCFEVGGYEPSDLLGHRLAEFVHPAKLPDLEQAMEATLAGDQVNNLELAITRRDGSVGQFSVNLSPMRDEQGSVSSIVTVMTDVTEAVQLEAKLRHTEKMAAIGQLVSGVAHEVNNPLTAILGFADLLSEDPAIPESARKDLEVIVQEAQRTKLIVQNLLSFARKMPARREPVQLNEIIRRTIQLRAYDFASHNVEITEDLQGDLPEVIGDAHQLQQVVLNILNNAYDAVRDGGGPGRIAIVSREREGANELVFSDNGKGIAHPERIFDPFFTTKEVGKGTGLGLSICYGILREHGGEVSCRNNEDGPGATFTVRLPHATPLNLEAMAAAAAGQD
ncbi:MAG TPA: PAS domain S-box protein, partial [Terriglobales bacterium]|nr:PAS domain S-box protein [Terriglobales bacterium]